MEKWISEYETLTSKSLDHQIVDFLKKLELPGMEFCRMGRSDASSGLPPLPDGVFHAWAQKTFADDPRFVDAMSQIMKRYYFDGRKEVQQ